MCIYRHKEEIRSTKIQVTDVLRNYTNYSYKWA